MMPRDESNNFGGSGAKPKRKKGNPHFVKGCPGGPGRPKSVKTLVKIERCADFMEQKGWDELEHIALDRHYPKCQVAALQILASYGYGKPTEQVDVTSKGEAMTISDFLGISKHENKDQAESTDS